MDELDKYSCPLQMILVLQVKVQCEQLNFYLTFLCYLTGDSTIGLLALCCIIPW